MGRPPTKTPNDELDKFLLRMPDGLRARIKLAADANGRSMNAEIVSALEEAYPFGPFDFGKFLEEKIVPIANAKTADERASLIEVANAFLKDVRPDVEVREAMHADGSTEVYMIMDNMRFIVGKAAEVTFGDSK